MMENFKLIPYHFDPKPVLDELAANADIWNEITLRQTVKGSPHGDTETIFLRWCEMKTIQAVFTEIPAVDYPALAKLPEAMALIDGLLKSLNVSGSDLGRSIIVSLKPGGSITPHVDEGAYADHYERFHLCLSSDPGNVFLVDSNPHHGEFLHMRPGEAWLFNHKRTHYVSNNSRNPRIHLIVDAVAPAYRKERDLSLTVKQEAYAF